VWGGSKSEYYSGASSDEKVTVPYIDLMNKFIRENSIKSFVDLGCVDFRVGRLIEKSEIDYTRVDIVQNLIDMNIKIYGDENVEFLCINAVDDELPAAELCLIR